MSGRSGGHPEQRRRGSDNGGWTLSDEAEWTYSFPMFTLEPGAIRGLGEAEVDTDRNFVLGTECSCLGQK
jgi:hypothetical protein